MAKGDLSMYDAIEEYVADAAEKGKGEPGFWNGLRNGVTTALQEAGFRVSPNVKDVQYMLWLAKNMHYRTLLYQKTLPYNESTEAFM